MAVVTFAKGGKGGKGGKAEAPAKEEKGGKGGAAAGGGADVQKIAAEAKKDAVRSGSSSMSSSCRHEAMGNGSMAVATSNGRGTAVTVRPRGWEAGAHV